MSKVRTIVLITDNIALKSVIVRLLGETCQIIGFSNIQSSLDYIYNSVPDLLIIRVDFRDALTLRLLNDLKSDPIFGQLPALAVFDDDASVGEWKNIFIDDYIRSSLLETDLKLRVDLCIHRSERVVDINPLTRLPGNIAIIKQIQNRLNNGEVFALAYADLDYFKPFNDKYGFSRGDEVLNMVGRLILNIVKNKQAGSFVGHIGGDDFVFIVESDLIEDIALEIIDNFERIIPMFYDPENRLERGIASINRAGERQVFPFMSISIGIVTNIYNKFSHYGEMTEIASEMKKFTKTINGSYYKIDRRKEA